MARVVPIGEPANDSERLAIAHLKKHLPASCVVMHNFEIAQGVEIFEIDLAILTPHCIFVGDIKGTQGRIDIYGSKWYPDGRQPYHSPLAKLRQHAKVLKTLICDAYPSIAALREVHVHATVVMTATSANVVDHGNLDGPDVVSLAKSAAYFLDTSYIPQNRSDDIRTLLPQIESAIQGKSRPKAARLIFGSWQVEEKLGEDDRCTEYRARHRILGTDGGSVRLRVYRINPYQEKSARDAEWRRVSNGYRAFANMPGHPNIVTVRDLIPSDEEDNLALVTEDATGKALRLLIKQSVPSLTIDQKMGVVRGMLAALGHAHGYGVIHRNLTPDAVLVSAEGVARLTGFDYARIRTANNTSLGAQIVTDLDPYYQAPECFQDPSQATVASDLFSAGLIFYELMVGEPAFKDVEHMIDTGAIFPVKPSELKPDLPTSIDHWLQRLCAFEATDRFTNAAMALEALELAIAPPNAPPPVQEVPVSVAESGSVPDLAELPRDYALAGRFIVQSRLGKPGGFGVAYKVFDSYADMVCVIKLILQDRRSVFERLLQEYRTLIQVPEHPYVVKVIWADRLPDATPYIVFNYVEGLDVEELLEAQAIGQEDSLTLAQQAAEGLAHLHKHGVYHQDIKPSNLLWTDKGVRIIDFNVASSDRDADQGKVGGTWRYTPPDLDLRHELTAEQKVDRDLFALAITLYECLTGRYPWAETRPSLTHPAASVQSPSNAEEVSPEIASLLAKALSLRSKDRFKTAEEFLAALNTAVTQQRPRRRAFRTEPSFYLPLEELPERPNTNLFVGMLQTLYSQSASTNAGTRGLDQVGKATYVSTLLDTILRPEVLKSKYRLVIISGNAGDGKTAFIQQLERDAEKAGAHIQRGPNGTAFTLNGHSFLSNYDGSQDEGDETNDAVLMRFLGPFAGKDDTQWPTGQTRLIAINEGRLVDFLTDHTDRFPRLRALVHAGVNGAAPEADVAVINLNLRSVVTDSAKGVNDSIFDRLLLRMTDAQFWAPCEGCDLKERCYIYHNVRTFTDPVAGPKVRERLKTLYTITHLRGRLHITLRDLRSALAYTLVGTNNCDAVHSLYEQGTSESMRQIQDGFYFNSWMGGSHGSKDRLLSLLKEIDLGEVSNPELDRSFGLMEPNARQLSRFNFARAGRYDDDLFEKHFHDLPRDFSAKQITQRVKSYQDYVAMLRRRHFFERRDDGWRTMLPYQNMLRFYSLVTGAEDPQSELRPIIEAINKGEGLSNPARLGERLALRVRVVDRGTIRSYRLFERESFSLVVPRASGTTPFVETFAQALILKYTSPRQAHTSAQQAELRITLDVFEMLKRLFEGYHPSLEEAQGFYLSLTVFKNVLASASYQEVLLTETGHEFYRIRRSTDGTLTLAAAKEEYGHGN